MASKAPELHAERRAAENARLLIEAAAVRKRLGAPDDLSESEQLAGLEEPLFAMPEAAAPEAKGDAPPQQATAAAGAADAYEAMRADELAACLALLDARSLRTLKAVSLAWRRRARATLGDPASPWRAAPVWCSDVGRDAKPPQNEPERCGDGQPLAGNPLVGTKTQLELQACLQGVPLRPGPSKSRADAAPSKPNSKERVMIEPAQVDAEMAKRDDADADGLQAVLMTLGTQMAAAEEAARARAAQAEAESGARASVVERREALTQLCGLMGTHSWAHSPGWSFGRALPTWSMGLDPRVSLPALVPTILRQMGAAAAELGPPPHSELALERFMLLRAGVEALIQLEGPTLAALGASLWAALPEAPAPADLLADSGSPHPASEAARFELRGSALHAMCALDAPCLMPHASALCALVPAWQRGPWRDAGKPCDFTGCPIPDARPRALNALKTYASLDALPQVLGALWALPPGPAEPVEVDQALKAMTSAAGDGSVPLIRRHAALVALSRAADERLRAHAIAIDACVEKLRATAASNKCVRTLFDTLLVAFELLQRASPQLATRAAPTVQLQMLKAPADELARAAVDVLRSLPAGALGSMVAELINVMQSPCMGGGGREARAAVDVYRCLAPEAQEANLPSLDYWQLKFLAPHLPPSCSAKLLALQRAQLPQLAAFELVEALAVLPLEVQIEQFDARLRKALALGTTSPQERERERARVDDTDDDDSQLEPETLFYSLSHEVLASHVVPLILASIDPSADRRWRDADGDGACDSRRRYDYDSGLSREYDLLRKALEALAPRKDDWGDEASHEASVERRRHAPRGGGELSPLLTPTGARRAESCRAAFTAAATKLAELLRAAPRERPDALRMLRELIFHRHPELGGLAVPGLDVAGSAAWARPGTVADIINRFTVAALPSFDAEAGVMAVGAKAFYVCVDGAGVGYRETMDLGDRCSDPALPEGVGFGKVVAGTVAHEDWLLEREHGKYLPLVKRGRVLFRAVDEPTASRALARVARAKTWAAMPAEERSAAERALLRRILVDRALTADEEERRQAAEDAWYGHDGAHEEDAAATLAQLRLPAPGETLPLYQKYAASFVAQLRGPGRIAWCAGVPVPHRHASDTLKSMDGAVLAPFLGELLPLIEWAYEANTSLDSDDPRKLGEGCVRTAAIVAAAKNPVEALVEHAGLLFPPGATPGPCLVGGRLRAAVDCEHLLRTRVALRQEWLEIQIGEARQLEEERRRRAERDRAAAQAAGEAPPVGAGAARREEPPWEFAERQVRRRHGEGHVRLAPLDAAVFALGRGHAAAVWWAAAAADPEFGLAQFVTTSDRFESGAYALVGGMRAAYQPNEVADAQRSMRSAQDARQRRAREREHARWRERRDEAVRMLANSPAALARPPTDLAVERCDAVRCEVLCMYAADGDLAGVRRLLKEGVAPSSAGLARPVGLQWLKLKARPTSLTLVAPSCDVSACLAAGQLRFDDQDLYYWRKDGFEPTPNSYVETEAGECSTAGGEFFKPAVSALDWAQVAVSEGLGQGVAVLEELQKHAASRPATPHKRGFWGFEVG